MKKLFLSLVAALVSTTMSFAQSSMLATLSHNGEISTFYGATALREAYNAATDGDIITLSSGSFVSVDIKKALTIRGAGMELNATEQIEPTVISGDFNINIPTDKEQHLTIESIYSNSNISYTGILANATFIKSRFRSFQGYNIFELHNATFVNCRIAEELQLGNNSSASCVNCIIWNPDTHSQTTSNFECLNCVLYKSAWDWIHSSILKNCILITEGERRIPSTCVVYYCLCLSNTGCDGGMFGNISNNTNWIRNRAKQGQFFVSGNCNYSDTEKFELSEEKQAEFIGTDGTQIGIYGGNMPFDPTPSNPQISKCNVASKSTADGKLSVDITVNAAK